MRIEIGTFLEADVRCILVGRGIGYVVHAVHKGISTTGQLEQGEICCYTSRSFVNVVI